MHLAAFASDYGLALGAVVVSIIGLLVSIIMAARSASASRVNDMERQLAECKEARKHLETEVDRLTAREIDLLRRIYRLENGRMGPG